MAYWQRLDSQNKPVNQLWLRRQSYAKTAWLDSHTHTCTHTQYVSDFDDNSNDRENLKYSEFYNVTLNIHIYWKPQNVTLFGNMFFASIIIVRNEIRNYAELGLDQNPMIGLP